MKREREGTASCAVCRRIRPILLLLIALTIRFGSSLPAPTAPVRNHFYSVTLRVYFIYSLFTPLLCSALLSSSYRNVSYCLAFFNMPNEQQQQQQRRTWTRQCVAPGVNNFHYLSTAIFPLPPPLPTAVHSAHRAQYVVRLMTRSSRVESSRVVVYESDEQEKPPLIATHRSSHFFFALHPPIHQSRLFSLCRS